MKAYLVVLMRRERSSWRFQFECEMSKGLTAWMRSTAERSVWSSVSYQQVSLDRGWLDESTHKSDRNEKSNMSWESPVSSNSLPPVSSRSTGYTVELTSYPLWGSQSLPNVESNAHKQPNIKFQYEPYSQPSRTIPVHSLHALSSLLWSAESVTRTYGRFPFPSIVSRSKIRRVQMNAWRGEIDCKVERY